MRKRLTAATLAALMALSMTACSGGKAAETTAAPETKIEETKAEESKAEETERRNQKIIREVLLFILHMMPIL